MESTNDDDDDNDKYIKRKCCRTGSWYNDYNHICISFHPIRKYHNFIAAVLLFVSMLLIECNVSTVSGYSSIRVVPSTTITRMQLSRSYNNQHQHYHQQQKQQHSSISFPSMIIYHPSRIATRATQTSSSLPVISRTIRKQQQQQQLVQSRQSIRMLNSISDWDGDDVRWRSKVIRRLKRRISISQRTVCISLLLLNVGTYLYQVMTTINTIRVQYPQYWPNQLFFIILDCLWGSARPGPFTMNYVHNINLSQQQLYRFLSAGFLHGSLLHLVANMNALVNVPNWVETGLGRPLYITTYLYSIIAGNVMDMMINLKAQQTYCLGASGGICGLYGLMFVCLVRMGNTSAASRIARGMVIILLYGVIFANISNASHVGGFLMGLVIGILSGPSYTKDYSMIRKNSLQVDVLDKDYRQVIGYDKKPSKHGLVPIQLVWIASIMFLLVQVGSLSSSSFYRSISASILRGFAK